MSFFDRRRLINARYLDPTLLLVDGGGSLRRESSTDGMHRNVDGSLAIREPLMGPVTEGASRP